MKPRSVRCLIYSAICLFVLVNLSFCEDLLTPGVEHNFSSTVEVEAEPFQAQEQIVANNDVDENDTLNLPVDQKEVLEEPLQEEPPDQSGSSEVINLEEVHDVAVPGPAEEGRQSEEIKPVETPPAVEPELEPEEDRHNFALAKDGAKIIAANKEAKKAGALLDSDGDTYLKNECKADKWVILELSQLTKMDTIAFSQNELYSSRIKEFEVRGRQSHPRVEGADYSKTLSSSSWQLLGKFNATNSRGTQVFKLESPVWLKYMQLRMLSHHGGEAVCALNDLCVYGKSAAEDLEDRLSSDSDLKDDAVVLPNPEIIAAPENLALGELPVAFPPQPKEDQVLESGQIKVVENVEAQEEAKAVDSKDERNVGNNKKVAEELSSKTNKEEKSDEAAVSPSLPAEKPTSGLEADPISKVTEEGSPEKNQTDVTSSENKDSKMKEPVFVPVKTIEATPEQSHVATPNGTGPAADEVSPKIGIEPDLPVNSASSSASRHGGSMYDRLVQELKSTRLAQKNTSRILEQLRRNVTAVLGSFAFDLDTLAMRLNILQPLVPAISPSDDSTDEADTCDANLGSNASSSSSEVVFPPSDLEVLQAEIAELKELLVSQHQRLHKLVIMPLFLLCGCLGLSLIYLVVCIPPSQTSFVMMTIGCCIVGWLLRTYSDDLMLRN